MIVIPGDRVRYGRHRPLTVVEAYLHTVGLVEITGTDGCVLWADPERLQRIDFDVPGAGPVPSWRR